MAKLPNKPSALIRVAIGDFRKVLRSKKYKVNMNVWHKPNGQCTVCLAGSVMAMSLGANPREEYNGLEFGDRIANQMDALNSFRVGQISVGVRDMYHGAISNKRMATLECIDANEGADISFAMDAAQSGRATWREFIRLMLKAADELEAIKL